MRVNVKRGRFGWLAAFVALMMSVVAGCGGGGGDASSAEGSGPGDAGGVAVADQSVQALYAGAEFKQPPAQSPKPQPGKKVWLIDAGLGSPGALAWAEGAKNAAAVMGWDVNVFDGQFTPSKWLEGVQQAIAAKADGIVLVAIDCAPVKAGLEQARAAGIKVVGFQGADCNDADKSAPSLFDGKVQYAVGGGSLEGFNRSIGAAQADLATVETKGKGKIILLNGEDLLSLKWETAGFQDELKKVCPGCSIVQVNFVTDDLLGPNLRQKIEQALLRNPDANALVAPFDDVIISSGGNAAVRNSGRSDQITVIGAGGYPQSFEEIRANKGLDATVAYPFEWESWAGMDALNRLFNGEPVAASGIGLGLVDSGHNDQSATGYVSPVDFQTAYRNAWQAGGR